MEKYKWVLGFIVIVILFGIGFLFGAAYVDRDVDDTNFFGLNAQLKREDAVLRLLKKQQFERASEIQEKFLLSTISQLQLSGRRLPKDTTQLISEYKDRKGQSAK
jgi:hypothetical protein